MNLRDTIPSIQVPKGALLLKEGKVCKYAYLIESGHLRAYYHKNGKEINLNFYFEWELATNLKSFFSDVPSDFTICAGESSTVRVFDKIQLRDWHREAGESRSQACEVLQRMLVQQEEHSNIFKIYNPAERYHYVAKHNPNLLQRVPLTQICSYLGISRETICRIRRGAFLYSES